MTKATNGLIDKGGAIAKSPYTFGKWAINKMRGGKGGSGGSSGGSGGSSGGSGGGTPTVSQN